MFKNKRNKYIARTNYISFLFVTKKVIEVMDGTHEKKRNKLKQFMKSHP